MGGESEEKTPKTKNKQKTKTNKLKKHPVKKWGKESWRDRAVPLTSFVISVQISVANKLTVR